MEQDSTAILCESCARDSISNKAVKFCNDCCENICDECVKFHRRNKLLANHTFRKLERETTRVHELWHGACSQHNDKQCEYVCLNHDGAYCYKCVILDHRKCNICTLDEYTTSPKHLNKLKSMQSSLNELDKNWRVCADKKIAQSSYLEQTGVQFEQECLAAEEAICQTVKQTLSGLRSKFFSALDKYELEELMHVEWNTNSESHQKLEDIRNGLINPMDESKQLQEKLAKTERDLMIQESKFLKHVFLWKFDTNVICDAVSKSISDNSNTTCSERVTFTCQDRFINRRPLLRDCVFLCDGYIVCTDETSKVLRLFLLEKRTELDYIPLNMQPFGIAKVSHNQVAVTFPNEKFIRIFDITINADTLQVNSTLVRTIDTELGVYGIRTYTSGIISACATTGSFYFYTPSGRLLNKVHIGLPECRAPRIAWHVLAYAKYFTVDDIRKRIYIACSKWNSVYCYDFDGKLIFIHDHKSSSLRTPVGVACQPPGDVFVSCYENGRIQRLDANGVLKHTYDFVSLTAPTWLVFEKSKCVVYDDNRGLELNVFDIEFMSRSIDIKLENATLK